MSKMPPQETLQIRVSPRIKKEIRRIALECDETLKTFVLTALRLRGLKISDEELLDGRKGASK